jgi:hypothetical protein
VRDPEQSEGLPLGFTAPLAWRSLICRLGRRQAGWAACLLDVIVITRRQAGFGLVCFCFFAFTDSAMFSEHLIFYPT